ALPIFGLGYHSNARFNDRYFSSGISNQSVTGYFLDHANYGFNGGSVPLDLVQTMENESIGDLYDHLNSIPNGFSAQQAMLAYQGYLEALGVDPYEWVRTGGDDPPLVPTFPP